MAVNKVSAVLEQQDMDKVVGLINDIKSAMPFLINLTEKEKAGLLKFGDKTLPFAKKTLVLAQKNQDFLPRNFDVAEFDKDLSLYESMTKVIQPLTQLMEKVMSTYRQTGHETYTAALIVYNLAKKAGKDTGGLDAIIDDIGKRFSRKMSAAAKAKAKA
jgi:hypothetical protein